MKPTGTSRQKMRVAECNFEGMENVHLSVEDVELMATERHADALRFSAKALRAQGEVEKAKEYYDKADQMWEVVRMDGHIPVSFWNNMIKMAGETL